jgi:hypothetical protein
VKKVNNKTEYDSEDLENFEVAEIWENEAWTGIYLYLIIEKVATRSRDP